MATVLRWVLLQAPAASNRFLVRELKIEKSKESTEVGLLAICDAS
jgi:hypothetical protein